MIKISDQRCVPRKKKRSALGCKRYKKRKNSSPCVRIRKRGEKRAPKLFLSRTHAPGRRQLARAQHRAALLLVFPSFVFVASFFTHVCMCVVRMCFKKRRFFSIFKLFFLHEIVKKKFIHHAGTRGKTTKVFLHRRRRVLAKTSKSETMSLFSSDPSHENRVRVR